MSADDSGALEALHRAQAAFDQTAPQPTDSLSQPWSQELVRFLALSVLTFAGFALVIAAVLLWRSRAPAEQVLRAVGVISILSFSALLLVVGYDNAQLTPIVGLFGAIAGYLLGKESKATIETPRDD